MELRDEARSDTDRAAWTGMSGAAMSDLYWMIAFLDWGKLLWGQLGGPSV